MYHHRRFPAFRLARAVEVVSIGWLLFSLGCFHTPNRAEPDDIRGLGPGAGGTAGGSATPGVGGTAPNPNAAGTSGTGAAGAGSSPAGTTDGPPVPTPPGTDGPEPAAATCGNGRLDPGETCDPAGDCLRACPEVTCTVQRLVGSPDSCNVRCEEEKITACASGDKCCPRAPGSACTAVNDAECAAVCDNGAVEAGETCDPKATCQTRADACKDDRDTLRTITGDVNACTTACSERKRPCQAGDSQCPTGCTAATDPDCGGCGNGRVETGETCDPPAECRSRADSCRDDSQTLRSPSGDVNACTFTCLERKRPCQAGDGECPSGCSPSGDSDCPGCGNRRVESGETCDPCGNTSCSSDRNTIRTATGSASSCTFRCTEMARACGPSDRECPTGCPAGQDPDCRKARGQPCDNGNECVDGNCADGVCCNTACNDGCRSCRNSGRVGTCSAPSNSEVCGSGPNGGNGADDNCNGQVDEGCCGGSGDACCSDRLAERFGCESGLTCGGTGGSRRCVSCGGSGQPCCNGAAIFNTCRQSGNGNFLTCSLNTNPPSCIRCGGLNELCCERNTDNGDYFCDNGLVCGDSGGITTCLMP
jgi:hypothetical protein